jgi:MFS transporter, SP family, solute carrier family 2 (facilitated glucose transporter), member 3
MGPVPFVLIPEMSPLHAVSALSSVGLATHWVANYTVGQSFLPLRNWLSGGDPDHEGRVFYLFAAVFGTVVVTFSRVYKG